MAFRSSLRIRQSLLWHTRYGGRYLENSADFHFLNVEWCLEASSVQDKDEHYYIKLKCLKYDFSSFEPFDVVTFLEDKRSNNQMFCSRVAVSSVEEILFQGSLNSLYEKLPGLKPYGDMTIVCTFYPSTKFALKENLHRFRRRESLVFETLKPTANQICESPTFGLQNSTWRIEVHADNEQFTSITISLKNCHGIRKFEPFEVKTFIEDKRNDSHIKCSRIMVTSPCEILYKEKLLAIYQKLPGLQLYDDMLIVCIFGSSTESTLNINCKSDTKENSGCFQQQKNAAKHSIPDLSNFLDKNIMTDIQLRCGKELIPAHKVILAARSEVFLAMCQHEMVESRSGIVEIKDIEPTVLRIFIKYLYSGQFPDVLSEDIVCKLYTASDKYSVSSLRKLCSCYMTEHLTKENCLELLMIADLHNDKDFKDSIADFIIERPVLMMNENWVNFSKESPKTANEIYGKYMTKHIPQ